MAWSIELSKFNIRYDPQGPIKVQHLENFINELHPSNHFEDQWWTLHVGISSNKRGCGARVLLEGPNQLILEHSLKFGFKASNNQVEYEELLAKLRLAKEVQAKKIKCWSDSKVVAGHINGDSQVKEPQLLKY